MKTDASKTFISLKALNELLSDNTRSKFLLNEKDGHKGVPDSGDGNQGEYNERFEFYKHPELPENIFLQITYQSDSYGDNEAIHEMKFVEGKAKTVTIYEPVK